MNKLALDGQHQNIIKMRKEKIKEEQNMLKE